MGAPWRATRYPSAASCAYASTTTPRETPELSRERARGRESRPRPEPPGANGIAKLVLELGAKPATVAVEAEQEVERAAHDEPLSGSTVDFVGLTRTKSTLGAAGRVAWRNWT